MLNYCKDYNELKSELQMMIKTLKIKGFHVLSKSNIIYEDLANDKIIIKSKKVANNRLILSVGLHGIEGYVGHATLMSFFDNLLTEIRDDTEVIIYHGINPYGMKHFKRTNENNVDLNRNFSLNNFSSENIGYRKIKSFYKPKKYMNSKTANLGFYSSLSKIVIKNGPSTVKESSMLGQSYSPDGICYTGKEFQSSTKFMLKEIPKVMYDIKKVVWIDLHTGYGSRYQMSVINSKHELENTKLFSENIKYPLVLGLNTEDFYDVEGDMLESIYNIKTKTKQKCDLYATCFEFGTLGDSTKKIVESLKATVFDNSSRFITQNPKTKEYINLLVREQFLPSEEKWRKKAEEDFLQAMRGIIKYKEI